MAANQEPIFPILGQTPFVQFSTANTNRDGTGTLATLVTGDADGTRVMRIILCATGTTTAGVLRVYISDGTNHRILEEVLVSAVTPSTTVKAWYTEYKRADGSPIAYLKDNTYSIRLSTHNGETFNGFAIIEDY